MNDKINGFVKWYDRDKREGYIIGIDEEKYYFNQINQNDIRDEFSSNEEVLFIPMFESEIPYAKDVEKIKKEYTKVL